MDLLFLRHLHFPCVCQSSFEPDRVARPSASDIGKAAAQVRQAADQAGIAAGRNKGIDDAVAYLANKAA